MPIRVTGQGVQDQIPGEEPNGVQSASAWRRANIREDLLDGGECVSAVTPHASCLKILSGIRQMTRMVKPDGVVYEGDPSLGVVQVVSWPMRAGSVTSSREFAAVRASRVRVRASRLK